MDSSQYVEVSGWTADGEYVTDSIYIGDAPNPRTPVEAIDYLCKRSSIVTVGECTHERS